MIWAAGLCERSKLTSLYVMGSHQMNGERKTEEIEKDI